MVWQWGLGVDRRGGRSLGGFATLFHRSFARELHAAFFIDADALDPNEVTDFDDVLGPVHAEVRQFADVHHAVLAGEHFDEAAEFLDRHDAALIHLADANFLGHAFDDLL